MAANPLSALLVLLLGAACGVGLAFALDPASGVPAGGEIARDAPETPEAGALRAEPTDAPGAQPDEAHLVGNERAAQHAAEVTARNETLKAAVTALEEEVAALEPEAVVADPKAFRFGVQTSAPNFDKADWKDLGGHMLALTKVLTDIRDEVLAGGQPSAKSMQGVQKHNTPLGLFALSIGAEMGTEAHIAYTHPAVISNLIRSSLLEAGDPLTRAQEIAITTLGDVWQREAEQQISAANPSALGRLVTEVESKLRFLHEVKGVLTAGQRGLLFDPETEGRSQLDLLSPAWVFALRRPLPFPDRAAMEAGLVEALFGLAEIEVEDASPYAWVGRPWVDAVPGALVPKPSLSPDVVFPHIDDLLGVARAEVQAIERLTGAGALDAEQKSALLGVTWLLHPHLRPAAPEAPAAAD